MSEYEIIPCVRQHLRSIFSLPLIHNHLQPFSKYHHKYRLRRGKVYSTCCVVLCCVVLCCVVLCCVVLCCVVLCCVVLCCVVLCCVVLCCAALHCVVLCCVVLCCVVLCCVVMYNVEIWTSSSIELTVEGIL